MENWLAIQLAIQPAIRQHSAQHSKDKRSPIMSGNSGDANGRESPIHPDFNAPQTLQFNALKPLLAAPNYSFLGHHAA